MLTHSAHALPFQIIFGFSSKFITDRCRCLRPYSQQNERKKNERWLAKIPAEVLSYSNYIFSEWCGKFNVSQPIKVTQTWHYPTVSCHCHAAHLILVWQLEQPEAFTHCPAGSQLSGLLSVSAVRVTCGYARDPIFVFLFFVVVDVIAMLLK